MEGEQSTSTSLTDIFDILHKSVFFWALLLVALCYLVYGLTRWPWMQRIARMSMWVMLLGVFFELGIAILWRLFFGSFDDVPIFQFTIFTVLFAGGCGLAVWPRTQAQQVPAGEIAAAAPPVSFDWWRASVGLFFGVALALAWGFAEAWFRDYHQDPQLAFRGFYWFFFAIRGIGGAIIGGISAAALAGVLPYFLWAHQFLSPRRALIVGGVLLVVVVFVRVLTGG
jgi:hypothetical protein